MPNRLSPGERISPLSEAINKCLDDYGYIPDWFHEDLKGMAKNGVFSYADFHATEIEARNLTGTEAASVMRALEAVRPHFVKAAEVHGRCAFGILEAIDTVNPFAWVRWGFGGTKPGLGSW